MSAPEALDQDVAICDAALAILDSGPLLPCHLQHGDGGTDAQVGKESSRPVLQGVLMSELARFTAWEKATHGKWQ